jgi:hypothetical protein
VEIQASLDAQGATPRETKWATVATVDLLTQQYKNITGKYNWFRIKHTPALNNTGTVDKILYR